jgi:hypothetical protein
MVEITFDFHAEGDSISPEPYLDRYELNRLFDHTREQIQRTVEQKLGDVRCKEHNQPPRVTVTGLCSHVDEQLHIEYHLDTCCKLFLAESISRLNH